MNLFLRKRLLAILVVLIPAAAWAAPDQGRNPIVGKWLVVEDQSGAYPSAEGERHIFSRTTHTITGRGSSRVAYQRDGNAVTVRWPGGEWMCFVITGQTMVSDDRKTYQRQK